MKKILAIAVLLMIFFPISSSYAAQAHHQSIETINKMGSMHQHYGQIEENLFAQIDRLDSPKILLIGEAFGRLSKKIFLHLEANKKSGEIYINDLDPRHLHEIKLWVQEKKSTNSPIKIFFIEGDITLKLPDLIKKKNAEYFDIITAFSVIHFLKPVQIVNLINNIFLALNKGGTAYYAFMTPHALNENEYLKIFLPDSFKNVEELRAKTIAYFFKRSPDNSLTMEKARYRFKDHTQDRLIEDYLTMRVLDEFRDDFFATPEILRDEVLSQTITATIKKIIQNFNLLKLYYIYLFNKSNNLFFPGAFYKEDQLINQNFKFMGRNSRLEKDEWETYVDEDTFKNLAKTIGFDIIFMRYFNIKNGTVKMEKINHEIYLTDLAVVLQKPMHASIDGLTANLSSINEDPFKKQHLDLHKDYQINNEARYFEPFYTISLKNNVIEMPKCNQCGKNENKNLLNCARCKKVKYCNTDCQKKDWPYHKNNCRSL